MIETIATITGYIVMGSLTCIAAMFLIWWTINYCAKQFKLMKPFKEFMKEYKNRVK